MHIEEEFGVSEITETIIPSLSPKDQKLITLRATGSDYKEIGLALGVSERRAQMLLVESAERLMDKLRKRGKSTRDFTPTHYRASNAVWREWFKECPSGCPSHIRKAIGL